METVDAIILSNTQDLSFYGLTQRTINTLRWSESDINFDIKVVETNSDIESQGFIYDACTVVKPNEKFNYNKFLNYGLEHCKNEWLIVCNNDLIFTKNWFTNLLQVHKQDPSIKSLCPFEPEWHVNKGLSPDGGVYFGYRTSYEIAGWCMAIHREIIEKCDLFDPEFAFWYQDNDYAETIRHAGYKHALVCNSRVYHMVSKSHELLGSDRHSMTSGQQKPFADKWLKR